MISGCKSVVNNKGGGLPLAPTACGVFRYPLILLLLILTSCNQEKTPAILAPVPVSGRIEVFNSSGLDGAASEFEDTLKARGFDVLKAKTDPQWNNYPETIIAIRNQHWQGDSALRANLNTKNFIPLQDTSIWGYDVTIYVGKDYKKVIK